MSTSGPGIRNRRLLAWLAALGSAGVAAAVTLAAPVTAADKNAPARAKQNLDYTLPTGWTDESKFQPQFVAHNVPMCFYQDGDPAKCYVRVESAGSSTPQLDEQVNGLVGPCLPDRARPTVSVLNSESRDLAGHPAEYTRWSATCPSGQTMGVQAHYVKDLGLVVWSYVDSVYGDTVDNAGVDQILDSLSFTG